MSMHALIVLAAFAAVPLSPEQIAYLDSLQPGVVVHKHATYKVTVPAGTTETIMVFADALVSGDGKIVYGTRLPNLAQRIRITVKEHNGKQLLLTDAQLHDLSMRKSTVFLGTRMTELRKFHFFLFGVPITCSTVFAIAVSYVVRRKARPGLLADSHKESRDAWYMGLALLSIFWGMAALLYATLPLDKVWHWIIIFYAMGTIIFGIAYGYSAGVLRNKPKDPSFDHVQQIGRTGLYV